MRSLWKGAVSFGLVHIPVKLYPATRSKDVSFNQLHEVCGSRIRYKRFCPHCNVEVTQESIVRGYEYDKDKYVIVSDEELDQLPVAGTKTIEIKQFVRLEEIDPVFYDKTYYLEPADGGGKAYALLRQALRQTGRIAIAVVVLRTKGSLCTLRVGGDALVMETMFYPDEIRPTAALTGLDEHPDLVEQELSLAVQLVESLTEPFAPDRYDDEYRRALTALINDKIRGEEIAIAPVAAPTGKVADLMAALRASLQATANNGHGTPIGHETQNDNGMQNHHETQTHHGTQNGHVPAPETAHGPTSEQPVFVPGEFGQRPRPWRNEDAAPGGP